MRTLSNGIQRFTIGTTGQRFQTSNMHQQLMLFPLQDANTANSIATAAESATSGMPTQIQMDSVIEGGNMGKENKAYESLGIYTKRTGSGLIQKGDALTLARMHGELFEAIRDLPEVDPIRHAKWIGGERGYCSACGHSGCFSDIWDGCLDMFCPNCGARMDDEDN